MLLADARVDVDIANEVSIEFIGTQHCLTYPQEGVTALSCSTVSDIETMIKSTHYTVAMDLWFGEEVVWILLQ